MPEMHISLLRPQHWGSEIPFCFGVNILSIWQGEREYLATQMPFRMSHNSILNFFFVSKKGENNFFLPLNIQRANTNLKEN